MVRIVRIVTEEQAAKSLGDRPLERPKAAIDTSVQEGCDKIAEYRVAHDRSLGAGLKSTDVLTVGEVATILRVGEFTVRRWIERGVLKGQKDFGGHTYKVSGAQVLSWLNELQR